MSIKSPMNFFEEGHARRCFTSTGALHLRHDGGPREASDRGNLCTLQVCSPGSVSRADGLSQCEECPAALLAFAFSDFVADATKCSRKIRLAACSTRSSGPATRCGCSLHGCLAVHSLLALQAVNRMLPLRVLARGSCAVLIGIEARAATAVRQLLNATMKHSRELAC